MFLLKAVEVQDWLPKARPQSLSQALQGRCRSLGLYGLAWLFQKKPTSKKKDRDIPYTPPL